MILSLIYGAGLAVFVIAGLASLRNQTPEIAHAIVVDFGSLVVLACAILPLVFGVDDTIDPRRFSLYGIPTGRLAVGLAAAAAISVPSIVIGLFGVAQVITWARGPLPTLLAIVTMLLLVPTCVLTARVSTGVAAFFLASRRAREIAGLGLIVVCAVAAPLIALLTTLDWGSQVLPIVRRIAAVAQWTPLGAVWSVPGDTANDELGLGIARLAIALVFVAALAVAWRYLVGVMLVRPEQQTRARTYSGLGWFVRFPDTPTGAIAARSLTYWSRDARYRVALTIIPFAPLIMVLALGVAGVPWAIVAWIPVPVMCLFLGWTVHNDVAYDSTAFWTHVSANTQGRADRWGRAIPALLVGGPLILVGSVVTTAITGDWMALPGLIGLSACILLVGLGTSSVVSAAFPYPVVRPGDSPFAQPQAAGAAGATVQSLSFFAIIVSAAPSLVFVVLAAFGSPAWLWLALVVGLGIGVAGLIAGIRWGGAIMDRRAPELLAFTLQN
jgi:ABC-2 type transport system permease protein